MSSVKSSFKGLHWDPRSGAWTVQLYFGGKRIWIGQFRGIESERKAAIAYDKKAILLGLPTNILKPLR